MDREEREMFLAFLKEEMMAREEMINEAKRSKGR
jgi:hypothetical protein